MKRFLPFFLSFLVVVPLLCLGVFAYEPEEVRDVNLRSVPDSPLGYSYSYVFKEVITPPTIPEGSNIFGIDFVYNGVTYHSLASNSYNGSTYLFYWRSGEFLYVYDFGTDTWVDDSYRYITILSLPNQPEALDWLDSNEYNPLSPQVTSALTFIGQVLNFITSSNFILIFLGLSIGLCLIVPFSIRKIKQFVKGY